MIEKHIFKVHCYIEGAVPEKYKCLAAPTACGALCGSCHNWFNQQKAWKTHRKEQPEHKILYQWLHRDNLEWDWAGTETQYVTPEISGGLDKIKEFRKDHNKKLGGGMLSETGFIGVDWDDIKKLRTAEFQKELKADAKKTILKGVKRKALEEWRADKMKQNVNLKEAENRRKAHMNPWDSEDEVRENKDRTILEVLETRSMHLRTYATS